MLGQGFLHACRKADPCWRRLIAPQPEYSFADDVPLDLGSPAGDGRGECAHVPVEPAAVVGVQVQRGEGRGDRAQHEPVWPTGGPIPECELDRGRSNASASGQMGVKEGHEFSAERLDIGVNGRLHSTPCGFLASRDIGGSRGRSRFPLTARFALAIPLPYTRVRE